MNRASIIILTTLFFINISFAQGGNFIFEDHKILSHRIDNKFVSFFEEDQFYVFDFNKIDTLNYNTLEFLFFKYGESRQTEVENIRDKLKSFENQHTLSSAALSKPIVRQSNTDKFIYDINDSTFYLNYNENEEIFIGENIFVESISEEIMLYTKWVKREITYFIFDFNSKETKQFPISIKYVHPTKSNILAYNVELSESEKNSTGIFDHQLNLLFSHENDYKFYTNLDDFVFFKKEDSPIIGFYNNSRIEFPKFIKNLKINFAQQLENKTNLCVYESSNNNLGLISFKGDVITDPLYKEFNYVSSYKDNNSYFFGRNKNHSSIYNSSGKQIIKDEYDKFIPIDSNMFSVQIASEIGLIDSLNNFIIPMKKSPNTIFVTFNDFGQKCIYRIKRISRRENEVQIFDTQGNELAELHYNADENEILTLGINGVFTVENLKTLDRSVVRQINKSNTWQTRIKKDNKVLFRIINNEGKPLSNNYNYIRHVKNGEFWLLVKNLEFPNKLYSLINY